jgi:hypothetical protein
MSSAVTNPIVEVAKMRLPSVAGVHGIHEEWRQPGMTDSPQPAKAAA